MRTGVNKNPTCKKFTTALDHAVWAICSIGTRTSMGNKQSRWCSDHYSTCDRSLNPKASPVPRWGCNKLAEVYDGGGAWRVLLLMLEHLQVSGAPVQLDWRVGSFPLEIAILAQPHVRMWEAPKCGWWCPGISVAPPLGLDVRRGGPESRLSNSPPTWRYHVPPASAPAWG